MINGPMLRWRQEKAQNQEQSSNGERGRRGSKQRERISSGNGTHQRKVKERAPQQRLKLLPGRKGEERRYKEKPGEKTA